MTKSNAIKLLIVTLLSTLGIKGSFSDDLEKVVDSQKKWQPLKQTCNGSYTYIVEWHGFAPTWNRTTIFVRDNQVVGRAYRTFSNARDAVDRIHQVWEETADDLGSHKQGAPPKTLDALYQEAIKIAGRKLADYERRHVAFDQQGLLLKCFIVDNRIADGPNRGVDLASISLDHAGSHDHSVSLQLTDKDNGKTFKVPVGEKILINLSGNPTTGFSWNNATRSKKLKLSGEIAYQSEGTQLGSGGVSTATFVAAKVGQGKIILEYKRVFEEKPPAKTFSVKIDVVEPTPDKQPETTYQAPNGKKFPVHWGAPPRIQTRDRRPLPGGYGQGSGTLARWIQENLDRDAAGGKKDK